jgi:hypothetical protein
MTTPRKPRARRDPMERFWAKVEKRGPDECWLWTASVMGGGYGNFSIDGRPVYAHRWIYEQTIGPIPSGLTLDHTCHNADQDCPGGACAHHRCVNTAHLEPVSQAVNSQRGQTGKHNAVKMHCPRGHPYSGSNLYVDGAGRRRCRECLALANAKWYVGARERGIR